MTKLQAQVLELKWFYLGLNSFWSTWAIISCIQSGLFYQITLFQRRNPQKSFSFGSVPCKSFVDFKSNQDGMLRKAILFLEGFTHGNPSWGQSSRAPRYISSSSVPSPQTPFSQDPCTATQGCRNWIPVVLHPKGTRLLEVKNALLLLAKTVLQGTESCGRAPFPSCPSQDAFYCRYSRAPLPGACAQRGRR